MHDRYQSFLRASRTENFSDFANLGAFYKAGLDYQGRQIIIFIGRNFAAPKADLSKVRVLYIVVPVCYSIVQRGY